MVWLKYTKKKKLEKKKSNPKRFSNRDTILLKLPLSSLEFYDTFDISHIMIHDMNHDVSWIMMCERSKIRLKYNAS